MKRYFFDVKARSVIHYDFRGSDFAAPEQARQQAELIALDVECTEGEECGGGEIQVRDIVGKHLFSVPVREPDLIAA
jgi:uncharacterized protein DUF6894